jgi:anaerobic selenocysteine-containing dehydrogenase
VILREERCDRDFIRRWVNWDQYLREEHADKPQTFDTFLTLLKEIYGQYTPEFAANESGADAAVIEQVAREIGRAGHAFAAHVWRNAAAGNLGGWQVARALEFLSVLVGAVGAPGGTAPAAFNKFVPAPPMMPPAPNVWNELMWPRECRVGPGNFTPSLSQNRT